MAFLNPFFLLGAVLAGVPVLVHLVRRTRARREPFPSLMFLRKIEQKTIRRRTIRNWLLLALRCLALLFLALAFARPYLPALVSSANSDQKRASVILIDVSYSMRYGGLMARAKSLAADIARSAGSEELVAVAAFGQSFDVVTPLNKDHQSAVASINAIEAGLESTNYEQAISGGGSLLKDSGAAVKRIHLVSDFQTAGWDRSRTAKLAPDVELKIADVGDPEATNVAVTKVTGDNVVYSQKYSGKLTAQISNFSSNDVSVPIELKLNDLTLERREIKIAANGSVPVDFSGFNVQAGSNRATVEITGDNFQLDNRYFFALRRDDQQKVLVIETPGRGRSESFFLQQALAAGENAQHALTVRSPGTLNPADVDSYQIVVVDDANVGDALADALKKFVQRGGGLILAAARHTESDQFNKYFAGVAPVQIGDTSPGRSYAPLSQLRTDHPLFAPFSRSGRLASPRIYAHRTVRPNDGAVIVAALDDGSPIIVDGTSGKGRVIFVATSLDTSWNDMPLTPLYLPLMRRTLEYARGTGQALSSTVGTAFRASSDAEGNRPSIESPAGGRIEDAAADAAGDQVVPARAIGFYKLKYRDRTEFVAVNLDTTESDFSHMNVDDFVAAVTSGDAQRRPESAASGTLTAEQIEGRQRIWLPLLLTALTAFVVEALLARRVRLPKLIHL